MKTITRLLKQVGLCVYGGKGHVEHKTQVVKTRWALLDMGATKLAARNNPKTRCIEIFEEFSLEPIMTIPFYFTLGDDVGFTKCKVCGNIAVFDKSPDATQHKVLCIQKPPFHEYLVDDLNKIEEMKK